MDGRFYSPDAQLSSEQVASLVRRKAEGHAFASRIQYTVSSGRYTFRETAMDPDGGPQWIEQMFSALKRNVEAPSVSAGVCCFSETPFSIPMWAHYGANHSGICIEYKLSPAFIEMLQTGLLHITPVEYRDELVVISLATLIEAEERQIFELIARYKSPEWSYEREWRLITQASGEINNPLEISSVIFGNRSTPTNVNAVFPLFGFNSGISFYICIAEKEKYGLRLAPLEAVFGPILHDRSIFAEMRELARERGPASANTRSPTSYTEINRPSTGS